MVFLSVKQWYLYGINILNFIYRLLLLFIIEIINHNHYIIIIIIKLLAPRFLGGRENLPLLDICASNLGIIIIRYLCFKFRYYYY